MPSNRKKRGKRKPAGRRPPEPRPDRAERPAKRGLSTLLTCALLAAATFAVLSGVLRNGFVSFDDEIYVLKNPHVRAGLTGANVAWAVTATDAANWHPLTWISHMTDVALWGVRPGGHHATSLLPHVGSVLLVFLLLRCATGSAARSAAVALLFGLHPLRVESVAWVAERKDVLSVFFGLAAVGAWGAWVLRRKKVSYAVSLVLFAASLLSKGTLVTMPLLLLVLDFWPLRRADPGENHSGTRWRRLLVEKVPYVLLSAAASIGTFQAQRAGGATSALSVPLLLRLENAAVGCVRYLGKIFWPSKLAVLYPHPAASVGWKSVAAVLLLAGITAGAVLFRRTRPWLLAGWLWYLIALLPVLGLVQVGWQSIADRYTYVPSLGILAALVWEAAERARDKVSVRALAAATAAVLLALSIVTWRQVATWRDSLTLYQHAVAVTGPNETMQIDLGNELARRGRTEEARRHFAEALRIAPGSKDALYALGTLALNEGQSAAARDRFQEAVRLHPDFAEGEIQTAVSFLRDNRPGDAASHAARALAVRPGMPEALYVLGTALDAQGRGPEAQAQYERAIAARPGYAEAHENLGELLAAAGKTAAAIPHFEAALRANPDFAEARQSLEAARKAPR
ncbi:MAG: tetratricopeptide repeat protein [Acidobacteria bacterium]|nr:tetratricopeptide repeat protein [Acidobacteriota bacterium]MCA1612005.1 tetratricopeptide repeat protein [Acidobacteriota bacterium]